MSDFEKELIKSLEQALAHVRGEIELKTTKVRRLRYCNYCKKGTKTKEDDCVDCGFSKPDECPSQYVYEREEE